jgi:AcrR family transcriptional regulator
MGRGKKIVDTDLVVDEAVALIEEGGVEEFSTRRLASRLGISAMTLYNYYANRDAILAAALAKGRKMLWSGLPEEIDELRNEGGNPLGAFRLFADRLLVFALERPRLCRFILSGGAEDSANVGAGQVLESLIAFAQSSALIDTGWLDLLKRHIFLFEMLADSLAMKVLAGSVSPEEYKELAAESYQLLLGSHESGMAQAFAGT